MSQRDTTQRRSRDAWKARALAYERAIRLTLKENAHLADGDNCTLIELKRALRDNAPMVVADDVQADDKLHARPTVETMRRWIEQVQQDVTGAVGGGMTDTDINPRADQTSNLYQPVAFTSDAPTEWRPKPNRAQRREIERRQAFYRRVVNRVMRSRNAQTDVDISGASEGVKK
jgi:hypothetical protein